MGKTTFAVEIFMSNGGETTVTINAASREEAIAKAKAIGYNVKGSAKPVKFISESMWKEIK